MTLHSGYRSKFGQTNARKSQVRALNEPGYINKWRKDKFFNKFGIKDGGWADDEARMAGGHTVLMPYIRDNSGITHRYRGGEQGVVQIDGSQYVPLSWGGERDYV